MTVFALLFLACSAPQEHVSEPVVSITAKPKMHESLQAGITLQKDPSDGKGTVWLEENGNRVDFGTATAGRPGSWTIVYQAGPLGISKGGSVFLQSSPFWGWSTPQILNPNRPGFTEINAPENLEVSAETVYENLLRITMINRDLKADEKIVIHYRGLADRYSEDNERLWIAVDGNGDNIREVITESPIINVSPGPLTGFVISVSSVIAPTERAKINIAAIDAKGNAVDLEGAALELDCPGLDIPKIVHLGKNGALEISAKATNEGIYFLKAKGPMGIVTQSNVFIVSKDLPNISWGDLHGHTQLSDGTGTPDDYFWYARNVAGLDYVGITDHDHWGIQFLDSTPNLWEQTRLAVEKAHDPGNFVALLGYEWTSWLYGHRHVLYFGDPSDPDFEIFSTMSPKAATPKDLWKALSGLNAISVPHHPAGGPIGIDWSYQGPRDLEPVFEISSVHGHSEDPYLPGGIYSGVDGNYVKDHLDTFPGFIGGSDSHDGHPGLAFIAAGRSGLMGVINAPNTRDGLKAALTSRRVYATNGSRMILFATLGKNPMGSDVSPGTQDLTVLAATGQLLEAIDIVRSGKIETIDTSPETSALITLTLEDLIVGEYVYVRARGQGGALAWSSPFYVVANEQTP